MPVDPSQSLLYLRADLEAIAEEISFYSWKIDPWPIAELVIYVTLTSQVDGRSWTLRLVCTNYPEEPPSVKCVNPHTKDPNDPAAWPQCQGFRPTTDLCMNISREGLMELHPDWQRSAYAWNSQGNPIHNVLLSIQVRLDDPSKYTPKR
jgi:ubiquitin-protein ligase